jgi:hypothetical protein
VHNGIYLFLFIGINKIIFAGWCVLVSFSPWAENDQIAFGTDPLKLLVNVGVTTVSFMKCFVNFFSPTIRTLHGGSLKKDFLKL